MGVQTDSIAYPFELIGEAGRGGLGIVYLAYHRRLEKYVVLKKGKVGSLDLANLRTEVDVLKNLRHTYLPQVYDFLTLDNDVYTVMDYIEGTTLEALLAAGQRPSFEQVVAWLTQLCDVLAYLHGQTPSIIHSDIKPANIMVTPQGDIRLIDFNVSLTTGMAQTLGYSAIYSAPEQWELARKVMAAPAGVDIRSLGRLTEQSDVYSLGATFYYLMSGVKPDPSRPLAPLESMGLPYPQALLRVVDTAVQRDPRNRFASAQAMGDALRSLERFDVRYRRALKAQWAVGIVASLMLAAGVLCAFYGHGLMRDDEFQVAFDEFRQLAAVSLSTETANRGMSILNDRDFTDVLRRRSADKAIILHTLGECYFQQGNYPAAYPFYEEALATREGQAGDAGGGGGAGGGGAGAGGGQAGAGAGDAALYYRDLAIDLARMGRYDEARELLVRATARGVALEQTQLVEAEVAHLQDRDDEALELIAAITQTGIQPDLLMRSYFLKARIYERDADWQERIAALNDAYRVNPGAETMRALAEAYAQRSYGVKAKAQHQALLEDARDWYKKLCALEAPAFSDRLNSAIVQRLLGDYSTSEYELLRLAQERPDEYRVYLNLAFIYDATGNESKAKEYCAFTLSKYRQTPEASRDAPDSRDMTALNGLARKLGV
jgi:tetratricopeptide (TPR) repeat protein/predicted Ser/Thr protein kinase